METLTFLCFTFRSYTRLSREVLRKTSSYFWWVGGGHKKPFWNVLGHSVLLNKSCFLLPRETILPEPILGFYQSPTELEEGKNPCQPYSKGRGSYWNPMKFTVQQHRLTRILQHNQDGMNISLPHLYYITKGQLGTVPFIQYIMSIKKKLQGILWGKQTQLEQTEQTSEPENQQECWNYQTNNLLKLWRIC